jgi:vacuolar-type H+-ATPase subunit E/Vma4
MAKALKENNKETMIIGIVREIEDKRNPFRVGIATGDEIYVVKPTEEGKNLLYEVGNKVEATGIITQTKDGRCRIDVSGYEVYEMDEEDLEEFGFDFDWEVK